MSNITEGRAKLEALATELKEAGSKGTAQKIMNIVNNFFYRSHVGVAQGPKSVKRASKKKDKAPAKKAPAKKSEKPAAKKKAPAKVKAEAPAKKTKTTAVGSERAKVAAPKKVKVAKPKATPAAAPIPADMDFPANV